MPLDKKDNYHFEWVVSLFSQDTCGPALAAFCLVLSSRPTPLLRHKVVHVPAPINRCDGVD